jgi:N-acylneuraminate cytidylyltransferase
MAYAIAAGLAAETVTRVIVSTDDERIAAVARECGAQVPFMRPAELGRDETPDLPVFRHALRELAEQEGYQPDILVQLRPTSPLRPRDCVDRAVRMLETHAKADSVRGVVPSGQNPYKMWRIGGHGRLRPLLGDEFEEPYNMPRQMLPETYWQTGHIDAIRLATITEKDSMSGEVIYPLVLDPIYSVDIDTPRDWARAEWMLSHEGLDIVRPGGSRRRIPSEVALLILDFDGVLSDNRVWIDADAQEMVAAHRGDGWGLARLKEAGVPVFVLSTETNPVVTARCEKLNIPVWQGLEEKGVALERLLAERGVAGEDVIYLGNDVNDLPCFPIVGWAVAVADAHPDVLSKADHVLKLPGGRGAVRELCDLILSDMKGKE